MKLISVIVTYNRLKKLKNTLAAYENQITHPYELIVVDNFSNDGTSDYLKQWVTIPSKYKKKVKLLDENQGGSGGFYVGEKEAFISSINNNNEQIRKTDLLTKLNKIK